MKYLYGETFQKKLLRYIVEENRSDIIDFIPANLFDVPEANIIYKFIIDETNEMMNVPTFENIEYACGGVFKKEDKIPDIKERILKFLDDMKNLKRYDKEETKRMIIHFIRSQELRKLLARMSSDFEEGTYELEKYRWKMDEIIRAGEKKDDEILYRDAADNTNLYNQGYIERIPTHLHKLNKWLRGGIEKGELGIIIGQSGIGKTFFLINLAFGAMKIGKNVVYYTFEISKEHILLRLNSLISKFSYDEIRQKPKKFQKRVKKKAIGELVIKDFPANTITVRTLYSHLRQIPSRYSFEPDLVLIDYADLLKPEIVTDADWQNIGNIYYSISGLGKALNVPVWTASQIKTSDYYQQLSMKSPNRSSQKIDIASVILGLEKIPIKTKEGEERRFISNELFLRLLKLRRDRESQGRIRLKLIFEKSMMKEKTKE